MGRFEEALAAFDRAVSLEPTDLVYELRAYTLAALGRWTEAIESHRHAVALGAEEDEQFYLHGAAHFIELGRFDEAVIACDAALAVDEGYGNAHRIRARALHRAGRRSEALAGYAAAINADAESHNLSSLDITSKELTVIVNEYLDIGESISELYNATMDAASALKAAAISYGLPKEVAEAIGELAAKATRGTTARAKDDARAPLRVVVTEDKTLGRLQRRYEERLASIKLPPDGFETVEQARAAGRLSATYRDFSRRLVARGLEPIQKDARIVEAERLGAAFYRKQGKPIV